MADDRSDFLERNRARARKRFVFLVVLLVFTAGSLAWRTFGVVKRMSEPAPPEEVRVFVAADLTAFFEGRVYGKDEVKRLLGDVAAGHPGASLLVCAPDVRNPTGAMLALWSLQYGLKGGLVRDTDGRCKR